MRGRERVVDEDVAERGHALGQFDVVFFLAGMEAGVLEHEDRAGRRFVDRLLGLADIDPVGGDEADRVAHGIGDGGHHHFERELGVDLALGAAEMGEDDGLAVDLDDFADGRHQTLDAGGVGHLAVGDGHVEIGAHQHALAGEIEVVEGLEGGHGTCPLFAE